MKERPILFSAPSHAHGEVGFWYRVDSTEGPAACWPWTGARNAKGYGRRNFQGRMTLAHRAAYAYSGREVPAGYSVDHLCRNRACCNPAHLEAVPHRINLLRGNTITARAARTTSCPKGHPYDAPNTRMNRGKRVCRECELARAFANYRPRADARRRRKKLTPSEVLDARELALGGWPQSAIASVLGVAQATVSRRLADAA